MISGWIFKIHNRKENLHKKAKNNSYYLHLILVKMCKSIFRPHTTTVFIYQLSSEYVS